MIPTYCEHRDTSNRMAHGPRVVGGSPRSPRSCKAGRQDGAHRTVMDRLFVGLDVAKDHLDVHPRPSGEALMVAHDEAGLTKVETRLRAMASARIVLEATGG